MARLPLVLLAAGVLAGASPQVATAQESEAGTAVMLMRVTMPDSVPQLQQAGLSELGMRLTYATDGQRVAMQMQFESAQAAMGVPLDDVLLHAIWSPSTDSVQIGLTLPLEMMTQLGGGAGFAFAFVLPDSINLPVALGDSMQATANNMKFAYRDLGTTATVAGVTCREYEMVSDSVTANVCLAKPPVALAAINRMFERLPLIGAMLESVTARQRELIGTDDIFTIRMDGAMPGGGAMHMELASFSTTMPDASYFTLPPGLGPVPPELIGAFMQGAAAATAATEIPDQP
jgi:hypothetical protein